FSRLTPATATPESDGAGATSGVPLAIPERGATSFVAYVMKTFGAGALRQFLAAYDPQRRDQAAVSTFQRPLWAIEEAWLIALRRSARKGTAFWTFLRRVGPIIKPYWRREVELFAYLLFSL